MGSSNWGSADVQPGANQRAKIFVVKFIRVKYFRTFSVSENIFATNKKRITVTRVSSGLKKIANVNL